MENRLKVVLYSYLFYPSVGGIESISASLAEGLIQQGHVVQVITESTSDAKDNFKYTIHRKPDFSTKKELVKWADIIVYNGASLGLQPLPLLYRKPYVWIHQGYQISCIDGLGWYEGERAPMTPWSSIAFHYSKSGLGFAVKGALKVFTKLFFAKYLVTQNVACTDWVLKRLPFLSNNLRIHSPYPLKKFETPSPGITIKYDFVFVGRLVSEKGVSTLIDAFSMLRKELDTKVSLLIVGDGNWKDKVIAKIAEHDLETCVTMVGRKTGQELTDLIHSGKIAVVPSEWEEPMGGVALELMSAGRNIIVSRNCGMAECVGKGGLTFLNGDAEDLARTMKKLWGDKALQDEQKIEAKTQLIKFQAEKRVMEHIELFQSLLKR